MRVIVGKPHMQTPMLASRLRSVVLNPYWNMPPDLAQGRAKKVLRQGPGLIARERLQILSDWSDSARPIPASAVDWSAVASGRQTLRLRQLPGGANVMGAIKFMMANRLGIYLHDFPDKSLFERQDRRLSSGCVRLADAPRLARWLFRGPAPGPRGRAPEQRVDLPEAVPVYVTYLTVLPGGPAGLTFQPDGYGRDKAGGGPPPTRARED
jgi:murein L,D-transpeptidase YcbB/YkuD